MKNVNTGKILLEIATACTIGILNGSNATVSMIDNRTWKSMYRLAGKRPNGEKKDKWDIKEWVHERYPDFEELPDYEHAITRGPRKGTVDRWPSDGYDAIAIASYAREISNG